MTLKKELLIICGSYLLINIVFLAVCLAIKAYVVIEYAYWGTLIVGIEASIIGIVYCIFKGVAEAKKNKGEQK